MIPVHYLKPVLSLSGVVKTLNTGMLYPHQG